MILVRTTVLDNTSGRYGGGIRNYGEIKMTNGTLTANSSVNGGGLSNEGDAYLFNVTVRGNKAERYGGGVINSRSMILTNISVSGNTAALRGGGIYNTNTLNMTNSTVAGNVAGDEGGGIHNNSMMVLKNMIVALNEAASFPDVHANVTNLPNLVGIDPLFVLDPDPGADGVWSTADDNYGNLHLRDASPAINVGGNSILPVDEFDIDGDGDISEPLPIDCDGNLRVQGVTVDIGAYESSFVHSPGDFNRDGMTDAIDIDLLLSNQNDPAIAPRYDLDQDSDTDKADLDVLIHDILNTHYGDANIDGVVNLLDLDILGKHYGMTGVGWGQGDFNANGSVTLLDFDIVGQNWKVRTMELKSSPMTLLSSTVEIFPAEAHLFDLLDGDENDWVVELF